MWYVAGDLNVDRDDMMGSILNIVVVPRYYKNHSNV